MKKLNSIIVLFAVFSLFSYGEHTKKGVVIVENNQTIGSEKVKLRKVFDSVLPEKTAKELVFSIPLSESEYFTLTIGDFSTSILLFPGDTIYVSSDFLNAENKSFSGNGALLSNYILNDRAFEEEIDDITNFDSIYSLAPFAFVNCIDSIYQIRNERLEKFIAAKKIKNKLFIATEQKRILYGASNDKNKYYRDHKFLTGTKVVLDSIFYQYLDNTSFNDFALMHLTDYRNFLYSCFEGLALQAKDSKGNEASAVTELAFEKALNSIDNPETRSYTLYRIMDVHLNEVSINNLGNLIDAFNSNCNNDKYKEMINNYYSKLEKLKSGMPAPDFTFPDINGQKVSLSDFKGKLVYIDIWNSNCSPCFKEFPIYEQLIEKYRGQEIVFLGISYDSDESLWKKTLEKKKLKGVQLFANGWNTQFGKDYLVYSNPRFILIDRNGNFISAKAQRPSENIDETINLHLK